MPIRLKLLLALTAISAVLWGSSALLALGLFRDQFTRMDEQQATSSAGRVREAIAADRVRIAELSALWEGSHGAQPREAEARLFFDSVSADFAAFVGRDGRVSGAFWRAGLRQSAVSPGDQALLAQLVERAGAGTGQTSGLVSTALGPMLVGVAPSKEGAGLVVGRLLDANYARELGQRLLLRISFIPISSPTEAVAVGDAIRVRDLVNEMDGIQADFVLQSMDGQPLMNVQVWLPSSASVAGRDTLRFFLGITAALALIVVLAGTVLAEVLITGRIRRLTRSASRAEQTGLDDLGHRFLRGNDEVAILARAMKSMFEKMRSSQLLYRAVVETQSDLIVRCRKDGSLSFCNDAFAKFVGEHAKALIGRKMAAVFPPAHCDTDFVRAMERGREAPAEREFVARHTHGTHEAKSVKWHVRPLDGGEDGAEGTQLVGHDITLQIQQESTLAEAKSVAERAAAAKAELLAILGHEVRTPLAGIMGFTSILQKSQLTEEQRECLHLIEVSGDALLSLTSGLQDAAMIHEGVFRLDEGPVELGEMLRDVIAMHLPSARAKNVDLDLEVWIDVPCVVTTDGVRLRQVLGNLVENGIKYTTRGFVHLKALSPAPGRFAFVVQDTGCGMEASLLEEHLEPPTNADASKGASGLGIGLTLCRNIVGFLGGQIRGETSVGLGTIITVELPLEVIQAPKAPESGAPQILAGRKPQTGENLRGLVVDDNGVNRKVAQRILRSLGIESDAAGSGRECLAFVQRAHYDIILMDLQMPEMSGLEATRTIRDLETQGQKEKRSFILAYTAFNFPEDRKRCVESGMDGFLAKPCSREAVRRAISPITENGSS